MSFLSCHIIFPPCITIVVFKYSANPDTPLHIKFSLKSYKLKLNKSCFLVYGISSIVQLWNIKKQRMLPHIPVITVCEYLFLEPCPVIVQVLSISLYVA